ncbi:MAG: Holliday junction branch migration protein RuvA [Lachnospiraceae bacterium]|nr:Holliday junction branch migration protein RuvA [Lachnospiraceae bacterium]
MIAMLQGKLEYMTEADAVILCGGVGYEVTMPATDLSALPPIGSEVRVYTHLSVNENTGINLFGFSSRESLEMFRRLITVSGIGPKGAVGILSAMSVSDLQMAILTEDTATIAKAPGIGKKTAAKLVLELKDKVDWKETLEGRLDAGAAAAAGPGRSAATADAIEALVALGYSRSDAAKAVAAVPDGDSMDSDDLLTNSLRYL